MAGSEDVSISAAPLIEAARTLSEAGADYRYTCTHVHACKMYMHMHKLVMFLSCLILSSLFKVMTSNSLLM